MPSYSLSARAEADYVNIFRFGLERFGEDRAIDYIEQLDDMLGEIAANPRRHPYASDGIARKAVFRSNVIYYEDHGMGVVILRILGQQNPETAFD